jgi:hypothetical protein
MPPSLLLFMHELGSPHTVRSGTVCCGLSDPQQPTPYPPNPSTYRRMSALGKLSGAPSRVRAAVALAVCAVAKCVTGDVDTVSCVALQNPYFDLDVLNGTHAPAYQYRCVSFPIPQPTHSSFSQGCAYCLALERASVCACVCICVRVYTPRPRACCMSTL